MATERPSGEQQPDDFERMVNEETGEPLLGLRQAALVDALIHRLSTDVPLSEYDLMAVAWLGKVLHLDGPISVPPPPALEA